MTEYSEHAHNKSHCTKKMLNDWTLGECTYEIYGKCDEGEKKYSDNTKTKVKRRVKTKYEWMLM